METNAHHGGKEVGMGGEDTRACLHGILRSTLHQIEEDEGKGEVDGFDLD